MNHNNKPTANAASIIDGLSGAEEITRRGGKKVKN
jgi:hypothetical protein